MLHNLTAFTVTLMDGGSCWLLRGEWRK